MPVPSLKLTAGQRRHLQEQLRQTRDARVYRRTLAILRIDAGEPITQVARLLGVARRTAHYWLSDYVRVGGPGALLDEPRSGRPSLWTEDARSVLRQLLARVPEQNGYYATNWTVPLLQEELQHATGICFSGDTVRRELDRQGYAWKRPRYTLEPDADAEKKKPHSAANRWARSA